MNLFILLSSKNIKAWLVALFLGLLVTTAGSYLPNPNIARSYSDSEWYFLNEGHPLAFKGLSLVGKDVPATFYLTSQTKSVGTEWVVTYDLARGAVNVLLTTGVFLGLLHINSLYWMMTMVVGLLEKEEPQKMSKRNSKNR